MKRKSFVVVATLVVGLAVCSPAVAAVSIDLSGAATGNLIIAPGGSFAQTFAGQTVSGITLLGAPTDPLSLAPSGSLTVEFWNGSNSILPQPNNQAPLSLLLDTSATQISWTMGSADGPSTLLQIDFFDAGGALVHSAVQPLQPSYNTYSFGGFGAFAGLSISNDNDMAGLRYQNFVYETAAVPAPGAILLGALGAGLVGWMRRRGTL